MTYAEVLIRKGKRGAAAYVQAECNAAKSTEPSKSPQHLNALLDHLLHPEKPIDDEDTIEWCRWLVGGGRSYEDFAANGEGKTISHLSTKLHISSSFPNLTCKIL